MLRGDRLTATLQIQRSRAIPAFIFAIIGAAFCAGNAMGYLETLCFTEGCRLSQDIKLFSLSLWWYGAGCLAVMGLLAILKQTRIAFLLSAAALAGDVIFLSWLALAAPCFTCMLGGFFFLAVFFALFRAYMPSGRWPKVLAALWFFALSPNLFFTLQEAAPPWAIYGQPDAPIQVYFAPTCPACHRTMNYFMRDVGRGVAVFPIARNETDRRKIIVMQQALDKGVRFQDAYMMSQAKDLPADNPGVADDWKLSLRLWRNKIALIRSGVKSIPLVIMQGGPAGGGQ